MVHHQEVRGVEVETVAADEFWSFVKKTSPLCAVGGTKWRLLDWLELGTREWFDSEWESREAYRRICTRIDLEY